MALTDAIFWPLPLTRAWGAECSSEGCDEVGWGKAESQLECEPKAGAHAELTCDRNW
jgi:hypothetical protein